MEQTVHPRQETAATGHRFFLLFLFLLAALILYPYAQGSHFGYYALRALGSAVILFSVYAVGFRRGLLVLAVVLAIPTLFQRTILAEISASTFSTFNIVISFLFDLFVVVVIFRRVFTKEQVNSETIFGALCIYLLVGFSFASVYGIVAAVQPDAFYLDPHTNLHAAVDRFDSIYYSFGTLTLLGANGITAVTAQARSLSIVEAILGVLYVAVLISRLMGVYRPSRIL